MEPAKKKPRQTDKPRKKKTKFEDEQRRLDILCLMINDKNNYYYTFYKFILDFECAKFNGKANVLRLYPHLSSIKSMNFIGNNRDSLFIHTTRTSYLYISPHFLYINPPDGRCLSEFITQQKNLVDIVAKTVIIPTETVRSTDGCCVEYFTNHGDQTKNVETFNLLHDCLNNDKYTNTFILELFTEFIDRLISLFKETKYLPYFIHPERLILTTSNPNNDDPLIHIKIASSNLLSYIFSVQNSKKKILNATFSHPMSFLDKCDSDDIMQTTNSDVCFVILDFFHSAFVTSLWILTSGQYQYLSRVKRNAVNNHGPVKISREKLNKIKKCWKSCNNDYGFCQGFEKKKRLVHNFGCLHLMQIMPPILEKTINESSQSLSFQEVESCVETCAKVFKDFLINMKNERDENNDDYDDEEEEEKVTTRN